uniref:Uncharacterized protein n=1 Tax=Junco hyemalis TaxID=40217 RepID=A0A8C5IBN0_JUNHY
SKNQTAVPDRRPRPQVRAGRAPPAPAPRQPQPRVPLCPRHGKTHGESGGMLPAGSRERGKPCPSPVPRVPPAAGARCGAVPVHAEPEPAVSWGSAGGCRDLGIQNMVQALIKRYRIGFKGLEPQFGTAAAPGAPRCRPGLPVPASSCRPSGPAQGLCHMETSG